MEDVITALSARDLEGLYLQPSSIGDYSPLNDCPLILLDLLEPDNALTTQQLGLLEKTLPQLPCPVIALANPNHCNPLIQAADIVVSSRKEAQPVVRNILQHPLTAMTLVQLLRHNENASVYDGLLAESLAYASLQGGSEFKHFLASRNLPATPPANQQPAILIERTNDTLTLTINRPEQRNAYSTEVRDALFEGLQLAANDKTVSKTVLRGAGSCFCTGGALHEFGLSEDTSTAHAIRSSRHVGRLIAELADNIECHLHKACIGAGIELPSFAKHITATPDTFFQLPEITMGLIPGAGGTISILNRIGRQRTAYLALSAKRINAATALSWGLIDRIT